jgi:hypothetical protein
MEFRSSPHDTVLHRMRYLNTGIQGDCHEHK